MHVHWQAAQKRESCSIPFNERDMTQKQVLFSTNARSFTDLPSSQELWSCFASWRHVVISFFKELSNLPFHL